MNKYLRVQQWNVFARRWLLYDAKWQDAFDSGHLIAGYLVGKYKPIYSHNILQEEGDMIVCINTKGKV